MYYVIIRRHVFYDYKIMKKNIWMSSKFVILHEIWGLAHEMII